MLCDLFSLSPCTCLKPELFCTCDFEAFMALCYGAQDCSPARLYFCFSWLSRERETAGAFVYTRVFL